MACKATLKYLLVSIIMNLYCHLLVLISADDSSQPCSRLDNIRRGGTSLGQGEGDIVHYDIVTVHVYVTHVTMSTH